MLINNQTLNKSIIPIQNLLLKLNLETPANLCLSSTKTLKILPFFILKRAGKNLNRKRFINALENLKNWESGVFPPITYSRNDHAGVESVMLLQLQSGKQVEISDWLN